MSEVTGTTKKGGAFKKNSNPPLPLFALKFQPGLFSHMPIQYTTYLWPYLSVGSAFMDYTIYRCLLVHQSMWPEATSGLCLWLLVTYRKARESCGPLHGTPHSSGHLLDSTRSRRCELEVASGCILEATGGRGGGEWAKVWCDLQRDQRNLQVRHCGIVTHATPASSEFIYGGSPKETPVDNKDLLVTWPSEHVQ